MSTKSLLYLQFFLILLLVPTHAFSQQNPNTNVAIKGLVIDSITSETIPYATIKISDKTKPTVVVKVVPTNDNGKFQLSLNKKGDYILTAEFVGKTTTRKEFTIGESKNIDLGTILMQDNAKLLGEVVVSAQKPLVKVDLDKITYSIEDDPEATTSTVLDMLKKVPMVTVDGEDNIQLKGSSGYKIYMNGKPSSMIASNPKDVLKSMPASSIKNIEVITDPGAKYDAEGLAGIINIITQKQSSMGGYNARINARGDARGGFGLGGFLTLKKGKFGFTGNYNYYQYKNPKGVGSSYTENLRSLAEYNPKKYLYQDGTTKYTGTGQYGSGEISYEIDTLNLINVGFTRYHGNEGNETYGNTLYENNLHETTQEYIQNTEGGNIYGSTGVNVDYQRSSGKVKDRLLTASYRLNISPRDWSSHNIIKGIFDRDNNWNNQYSDAKMNEHTFQLDYTTPIAGKHILEVGTKYILRQNKSNSGYRERYSESGDWIQRTSFKDKFNHEQNIISGYLGYNLKLKKIGFKTGLRYEFTDVSAKYPLEATNNFSSDYTSLVPSATITYQLKPMQNFRIGYNMRIMRPSISQLNPFANTTDSTNITIGNPGLDAVKSHSFNLNYSYFNPKFNFNANMSYNFSNNNIEQIMTIDNGIRTTNYENIGENKRLSLFTYFNWTPTSKIRITSNISGSYTDVKSNNEKNLSNSGFASNFYSNISYTFPKKLRLNGFGGFGTPYISLQSNGNSYNFFGLSVSKDFMNEKLNVNLSASNFIGGNYRFKNETISPDVYMRSGFELNRSRVNLSISFKFGEMKEQLKKAKRGITNDDSMGNSDSSGSGGSSQGQQGG